MPGNTLYLLCLHSALLVNLGAIQGDEKYNHEMLVGFDGGGTMRRFRYPDPETGTAYEFLTAVRDLDPGLIALSYRLRWRIEKVFDTAKNRLQETKGWATGVVAREIQAPFFALARNLPTRLRRALDRRTGSGNSRSKRNPRVRWSGALRPPERPTARSTPSSRNSPPSSN